MEPKDRPSWHFLRGAVRKRLDAMPQQQRLKINEQLKILTDAGLNRSEAKDVIQASFRSGSVGIIPNFWELDRKTEPRVDWSSGRVVIDAPELSRKQIILHPTISVGSFVSAVWPNVDAILRDWAGTTAEAELAETSAEQRPAAYRFTLRGDSIDVLPETPDPEDRDFALDTYNELLAKARELLNQLTRSNSARRACGSIERLLAALGTNFDDLRPGLLLSRVRSIEADRASFDSEEARAELFADALAMIDDTLQSARDLMTAFPIVRRIEAERLALDLDRSPEAVPVLRERMDEIRSAAERASAATEQAIKALAQSDDAIEAAVDPVLRTSLVADKLLVVRNFLGAAAGGLAKVRSELSEVGGESWAAIRAELPKGVGFAARIAPFMGLVTLVGYVAGPAAGIAAVVPGFRGVASAFKKFASDRDHGSTGRDRSSYEIPAGKSPSAVAKWMFDNIKQFKFLDQQIAASYILENFGDDFVYQNKNGNLAISAKVLSEFRMLTKDEVIWVRGERLWRLRESHHLPTR